MGAATDRVRAEYDKRLAEAKIEDALREQLPVLEAREHNVMATLTPKVHVYPLYGRVATVTYGDWSACGPNGKATWDHAAELVRKLPPVGMTLVRDGTLSFRPSANVEVLPEETRARWQHEHAVSPVLVHIEAHQGVRLQLEWTSCVAEQLVDVRAELGFPPASIGRYDTIRRDLPGRTEYGPARWHVPEGVGTVYDANDLPVAKLEAPIRWASGGPQYPGRITLYYVDIGLAGTPDKVGAAIVEHLRELALQKGADR